MEPAGTGVHRRDDEHVRGQRPDAAGARDVDDALLHRLAQHLEGLARELGQLVEEEHAACARARSRRAGSGCRRPRARPATPCGAGCGTAGSGAARVERRAPRRGRARTRAPPRPSSGGRMPGIRRASIVFPDPGGPFEEQVVAARGRDLERAPREVLAAHVGEVGTGGVRGAGGRDAPRLGRGRDDAARDVERLRHVRDPVDRRALDDQRLGRRSPPDRRGRSRAASRAPPRRASRRPAAPRPRARPRRGRSATGSRARVEPEQQRARRRSRAARSSVRPTFLQVRRREVDHHRRPELEIRSLTIGASALRIRSTPSRTAASGSPITRRLPGVARRTSAAPRA